jgi:uncharacterized membrane protein YqiK
VTVEELWQDRKAISRIVKDTVEPDIHALGFQFEGLGYNIQDLDDKLGYIRALGLVRQAKVDATAAIGENKRNNENIMRQATSNAQTRIRAAEDNEKSTVRQLKVRDDGLAVLITTSMLAPLCLRSGCRCSLMRKTI